MYLTESSKKTDPGKQKKTKPNIAKTNQVGVGTDEKD